MTLSIEKQEQLVRRAMVLAEKAAEQGDRPFAAILTDKNGTVVLEAINTANSTTNAAAHAEINLLYAAGKKLRTKDLSVYTLVSNAASCPMCTSALLKAKIAHFYYGSSHEVTMIPDITMAEVIATVPIPVEVHGGILAKECATQILELAER